jgi:hypothetical protein
MREANNEIGVGILFCIITLMSVICIVGLSRVVAFSSVAEDCQKLGAFYIAGTVYECKEKKNER